ncbi:MAG: phosphatidate cytidylyltransferase [Solirubrobacteraceae bacterium]|nr:phosphatidate cytidylyltransferase [Solirubrobacteraceae bacterium]
MGADPPAPRRGGRRLPSQRRATRAARRNQGSELLARVLVAIPAIAFALFIVNRGGWIFTVALIVLGVACLGELFTMLRHGHPVRLGGFLGLAGMLVAAQAGDAEDVLLAMAAAVPVIFLLGLTQPKMGAPGLSVTALGLVWIGLPLAHAVLLRELPHGDAIIIDVLVGTFVGDTGAYLGGRAFGRRPLAPRISPNKTVEGWLIGVAAGIAGVWFAGLYQDWLSGTQALLLGVAVALVAPLGDLFESYIKRDAGVKDSGRLFGAHGGALDRLDAVLFAAVAGYYVWSAMA